jgi:hypothetical protein
LAPPEGLWAGRSAHHTKRRPQVRASWQPRSTLAPPWPRPSIDWSVSNVASRCTSCVPARDRLLDSDICPASLSPLERKSSLLVLLGFILGLVLTIVLTRLNFPHAENPSQPSVGRMVELSSWTAPQPAMSRLIVKASQVVSGQPAPLGLALHGLAEDASVTITGLLPGMRIWCPWVASARCQPSRYLDRSAR